MTRKSYNELQEELRQAHQYVTELINDNRFDVVNEHAFQREAEKVISQLGHIALVRIPLHDKPPLPLPPLKRALHIRHPHILMVGEPWHIDLGRDKEIYFAALLSQDPETWMERVASSLRKNNIACKCAAINYTHTIEECLLTLLQLVRGGDK